MPQKSKNQPACKRVAIIVLNYNNPIATIRCLNSIKLLSRGKAKYEVIVVDNGSTDDSVKQIRINHRDISFIESKSNLGYAGGNNLGIKTALGSDFDYVLLLNNDTQIIDEQMLDRLIAQNTDLTAPLIKFHKNGQPFVDFGGMIDRLMGRNTHLEYQFEETPKVVPQPDYLSGTCILINSKVFKTVGLLDDKYFLYYEDVDFCLRAKKAGFSISVNRQTAIYHELSSSSNKLGKQKIKILATSHRRFVIHHLSPVVWPLALAFNFYLEKKST